MHQIRIRVLSGTLIRIEYPSRETGNAVILLDMQNVLQCTKLMEVVSGQCQRLLLTESYANYLEAGKSSLAVVTSSVNLIYQVRKEVAANLVAFSK